MQRRTTTAKSKHTVANFAELKKTFVSELVTLVMMEDIPGELILNWDQTGIKFVPCSSWTMDQKGARHVEMIGINDKRQITAVFCGSLLGNFLPLQVIYKGKTPHCHPRFEFPSGWHIIHSPKHWSTEKTMIDYINFIILPYVESMREIVGEGKAAVVIIDNFKAQVTESCMSLLESENIHVCQLHVPPNTTDLLQPMDVAVNKPAKDFIRRNFQQWYSEQVMKQLAGKDMDDFEAAEIQPVDLSMQVVKEVGAKWLVDMAEFISENPQFVVNVFIKSGALDQIADSDEEDTSLDDTSDYDSFTDTDSDGDSDEFDA